MGLVARMEYKNLLKILVEDLRWRRSLEDNIKIDVIESVKILTGLN
jgi:hypothetical protein